VISPEISLTREFDEQVKRSLGRLLGLTGDEPGPE